MNNKLIVISISIFIFLITAIVLCGNFFNVYHIKADIQLRNISPYLIDQQIASFIKDNISQIPEVKDVVIFSCENSCSVYCKLYPFCKNRTNATIKIKNKLEEVLLSSGYDYAIDFDDEFDSRTCVFLVISSDLVNYRVLKEYSDDVFDKLLSLKISRKIQNLGEQRQVLYLYFKYKTLLDHDIDLSDIKRIISENNLSNNSSIKTNSSNSYNVSSNAMLNSVDDVKNIPVFYKNTAFSAQFKDIFNILYDTERPSSGYVYFDNQKAQVFAICKKKYYLRILFNCKLKNFIINSKKNFPSYFNFRLIDPNNCDKIEVYFPNRSSIYSTMNEYRAINSQFEMNKLSNLLYFIGIDPPIINYRDEFQEKQKNKLTIFVNKFDANKVRNILDSMGINYVVNNRAIYFKSNSLADLNSNMDEHIDIKDIIAVPYTDKTMQINYEIDQYSLNDYSVAKSEIINTIQSAYNGLKCGEFYIGDNKIPIILQNDEDLDRLYFYSKKNKNLIYLGSVAKSSLKEDYIRIVRKNNDYIGKIIAK